jgi:hypothetical protein
MIMQFGWNQIWGIGVILVGIYWIINENIPVGIEGRPPEYFVRGKWKIILGILAILLGLFIALEIPKQIAIDRCLDSGGSFDYQTNQCIRTNLSERGDR